MRRSTRCSARPVAALLTASLAACSTLRPETEVPVDAVAVLKAVPRVANRRSAPCDMQREVAAQNSALDSGITGKPVTYAAPCDVEAPPPPLRGTSPSRGEEKQTEPKTS